MGAIAARVEAYEASGIAGILSELNAADALHGKSVRVDTRIGRGCGLDEQGRLLLRDEDDQVHAILSGTVELL